MTSDVLDRLRASNPLPHGSSAPELETLLPRLQTAASGPRRFRPFRVLVPALGVAVALAVLIGAIGALHAGHHAPVARRHAPRPTAPVAPTGGMPGLVSLVGAGFSARDGVISLQQCLGCLADGNQTRHSREVTWLARTVDGGRSWSLAKAAYSIQQPLFAGQDGWAGGVAASGVAEYYVSHDGGRTWSVAPAAAPNGGGALVSVGGGEVWAIGLTPANVTVMHAPVAGSRLRATVSQPIHGNSTNVQVIAGGAGTAYVANGNARAQTFVTHDDGHSWQRIQPPCPSGEGGALTAAYGASVWAECNSPGSRRQVLSRSEDGGGSWSQLLHPSAALSMPPQPVSPESAWTLSGQTLLRTTDGGSTWRTVWSAATSPTPALRSETPPAIPGGPNLLLIAQSPSSASLVTVLTSRGARERAKLTNLVVYRTTDGGRSWQPYLVPLGKR